MILSHILVAINNEIPEPRPYPFCNISSKIITITPEVNNCITINMALPAPRVFRSPYIPEPTYATASPTVINNENIFCAP